MSPQPDAVNEGTTTLRLNGHLLVSSVGLKIPRGTDYASWERAGARIMRAVTAFAWCLGDWVLYGQTRYPDRYRRAIEAAQLDYKTVRNYAWVARKFEMSRRRDTLSFQHHAEVAGLSAADQDVWLDRAQCGGWSRNELRQRLRAERTDAGGVPSTDLLPRISITPGRLVRWRTAADQAGKMLEEWITDTLESAALQALQNTEGIGPLLPVRTAVPGLIKSLDRGEVCVSEHEGDGSREDGGPIDSPEPILGPTQRALTAAEAARIVHASLGAERRVVRAEPLTGGGFATVWRADLDDDTSVVLKVGPAPDAPLLTYEADMVGAEADYLRTVRRGDPTVPVPEVLHHGADPDVIDGSWLVLRHLPGTALAGLRESLAEDQQAAVRHELGQTLARVHRIDGNVFGYPGAGRRQAATWREAYLGIIDDLLADAVRLEQELPLPPGWIRDVLGAASEALAVVVRPALVHFDLWDGNVLTAPDADGQWHLTGLVDGERSLYADPLVDFVSPELFGRIEDDPDHPFAVGYAAQAGPEFKLDAEARRRILLYRAWFYLLMRVEFPTRLISEEHQKQRDDMLREVLLAVRGDGP